MLFYLCDEGLVIELVASFFMIDTMLNVQGDVSVRLGTRDPGTMREIAGKNLVKNLLILIPTEHVIWKSHI